MIGVYCIICSVSGKWYVGKSTDIRRRWRKHKSDLNKGEHKNPHLQSAWLKYGEESFEFSILALASADELVVKEQEYMDLCRGENIKLYNFRDAIGVWHSDESKAKMSAAKKGKKLSDKHRLSLSIAHSKRLHTDEEKEKISTSLRTSEAFKRYTESRKGKKATDEHRQRISNALKGRVHSEEHKANFSAVMTGRPLTDSHRAAISAAGKGRKQSAEHVARRTASRKVNLANRQKQET